MTTTNRIASIPATVEARARFVGHIDINKGPAFMALIGEFKPMNKTSNKIVITWVGEEREFVFGEEYLIVVDTKNWQTSAARMA